MPTHTISLNFKTDAGTVPVGGTAFNLDTEINFAVLVAAGATKELALEFTHTQVQDYCFALHKSSTTTSTLSAATVGAVTIKANSSSAPAYSVTVAANQPAAYWPGSGMTNAISTDTTGLFLVNTGSADVIVSGHLGINYAV